MKILVLNYSVGNIYSISHALSRLGASVSVEKEISSREFDGLVMPGVGSFTSASEAISSYRGLLRDVILSGTPTLGICLGMQILFNSSDEGPGSGLDIFGGRVVSLPPTVKRPQMGWNRLLKTRYSPLLEGVEDAWVYFNHSYYPEPTDRSIVAAKTEYGVDIPSVISHRNIFGTQFHPEKSSKAGRQILQNFINQVRR
ncbi:Imidazole glycerol phosphate synthase subunit HisH [archaeon HR01]|nr:Imidazole glycerol phosphate synthase subunit HisH [archaeon HR01]